MLTFDPFQATLCFDFIIMNLRKTDFVENHCRRVEIMASERIDMVTLDSNQDLNSKIMGLESRIEHVASATFTNLR